MDKNPIFKIGDTTHNTTDDRQHPRLKNYSLRRNLNSVVDKKQNNNDDNNSQVGRKSDQSFHKTHNKYTGSLTCLGTSF